MVETSFGAFHLLFLLAGEPSSAGSDDAECDAFVWDYSVWLALTWMNSGVKLGHTCCTRPRSHPPIRSKRFDGEIEAGLRSGG